VTVSLWDTIMEEAAAESPLWRAASRPPDAQERIAVFSPLGAEPFALATETIYEGYLLHYARPRLFAPTDRDTSVLLGDYLYAHGLVRLADHGNVTAVADLGELISLSTQLRAEHAPPERDGVAWAATAALLGSGDPELEAARAELRLGGDPGRLRRIAISRAGEAAVELAIAAHRRRVE
jgi:hypothetical protein